MLGEVFLFKMVHLSPVSGGLSPVSLAVHVRHCGLLLSEDAQILRISDSKHRIIVSETELASASAIKGKREEATDGRSCTDLYKPVRLGTSFGLHITDNLFYILSKNPRSISPNGLLVHLLYLQYTI